RFSESDPQETLRAIAVGVGWARRTPSRCTNRNSGAALPIIRTENARVRMSKITAILGSALFFVVAPAMLAGVIPWSITHWEFRPPFLATDATRLVGLAFIIAGVPGVLDSFARFALQGLGTPAPIAPPRNLVVSGLYRYVRNPIYVAVVAVILGQGLLFADWHLLGYGALLWLFFHVWVVAIEEAGLRESFRAEYETYCANV